MGFHRIHVYRARPTCTGDGENNCGLRAPRSTRQSYLSFGLPESLKPCRSKGTSTMNQLSLLPPPDTILPVKPTTAERFAAFHAANPHVYKVLRAEALRLRRSGRTHYGLKKLWEWLRYDSPLAVTRDDGKYKLNNSYTRHYARLLMANEPELAGFFETRCY